MVTKKQLLQQLSFDVNEDKQTYDSYQRMVMEGIETISDFKRTLEGEMNKYLCLSTQCHKNEQWYLGDRYKVNAFTCSYRITGLIQLANAVGYELNIYNGFAHAEKY